MMEYRSEKQKKSQYKLGIGVLDGKQAGLVFPMNEKRTVHLGKDIMQVDIAFDKSYVRVSRKHCAVQYRECDACYLVVDLSRNGTYLQNGQRLPLNSPQRVARGSILKLADNNCRVKLL